MHHALIQIILCAYFIILINNVNIINEKTAPIKVPSNSYSLIVKCFAKSALTLFALLLIIASMNALSLSAVDTPT